MNKQDRSKKNYKDKQKEVKWFLCKFAYILFILSLKSYLRSNPEQTFM